MPKMIRWEHRAEVKANPKLIEDFKIAYSDPSLSLKLIGANFDMCSDSSHAVAARLGLPSRLKPQKGRVHAKESVSVLHLDDEIDTLKNQLATLERKRMDLAVKAERTQDVITIYGLSEPVTRHVKDLVFWLKAGGPQKIRQLIREDEWNR